MSALVHVLAVLGAAQERLWGAMKRMVADGDVQVRLQTGRRRGSTDNRGRVTRLGSLSLSTPRTVPLPDFVVSKRQADQFSPFVVYIVIKLGPRHATWVLSMHIPGYIRIRDYFTHMHS